MEAICFPGDKYQTKMGYPAPGGVNRDFGVAVVRLRRKPVRDRTPCERYNIAFRMFFSW
jgi:hypothetical protein